MPRVILNEIAVKREALFFERIRGMKKRLINAYVLKIIMILSKHRYFDFATLIDISYRYFKTSFLKEKRKSL